MSTDAQKRAAARKAKILARGNTGLAKLAQTARGEEAELLYSDSAPTSRPDTPSARSKPIDEPKTPVADASSSSKPSWAPESGAGAGAGLGASPNDPFAAMMAALGGAGGPGGPSGGEGMPDMSALLAQMMGGAPPGGPDSAQRLLGDLDDPAGLGGVPPGFPDLSALGGMGGMGGLPGMGMGMGTPPAGKGWTERFFPLVHFVAVLALLAFTVGWWEPTVRLARWGGAGQMAGALEGVWSRWGRLAGRRGVVQSVKAGVLGDVELLPIFWAFTTLELILQTTRFFILKSPPPPHSLISTFLPLIPPRISRPLITASRYLSMLAQTYKDGCLLLFGAGVLVLVAEYVAARGALV